MSRTPDAYFVEMYGRDADPWGYETRWYEQRKYATTLSALPRERYRRGFEPGCSIGVLTEMLASRCESLIALELLPDIAERARRRNSTVDVRCGRIPEAWPDGQLDLVVVSEVLYYLTAADVAAVLASLDRCLEPRAHVVAVHWTGETNYPLSGREVHAMLDAHPSWRRVVHHVDASFVLGVYEVA